VRHSVLGPAIALLFLGVVDARADALSDLEKAHSAYVAHKYADAEARLRDLLDAKSGALKDADSIADARMYLGAVLLAEGKKEEAADALEQLLLD
jgi:predicted negative regulator of RcsB-dependent stress response